MGRFFRQEFRNDFTKETHSYAKCDDNYNNSGDKIIIMTTLMMMIMTYKKMMVMILIRINQIRRN